MGRSIIIPPVLGETCAFCWGSGKPFGDGPTPSVILATAVGIQKGDAWLPSMPEPPNGILRFVQSLSCVFVQEYPTFDIRLEFGVANSTMVLFFDSFPIFVSNTLDACSLVFENEFTSSANAFFDGTVTLNL